MEGLLSFLLFAGLFYLMMRAGCGSHMTHGHRGKKDDDGAVQHVDPVCGMKVDVQEGYGLMHQGKLVRFCSRNCLDKFEADPEAFLGGEEQKTGGAT